MDEGEFRRIAGRFPTGVVVLTTALEELLHGITVNSLTSVSLFPLLVLVCIEKNARAHEQIELSGRFAVSFLGADQEAISRTFAAHGEPEPGRLRGVPFRIGPHGLPILEQSLAHFECEVRERFEGGDHKIFLAGILGGAVERDAPPLIFFRGRYGTIAPPPTGKSKPSC
jgi:flavin reductase (DIM6/NTAB) family NADH-FMN oxidoreductase RutF